MGYEVNRQNGVQRSKTHLHKVLTHTSTHCYSPSFTNCKHIYMHVYIHIYMGSTFIERSLQGPSTRIMQQHHRQKQQQFWRISFIYNNSFSGGKTENLSTLLTLFARLSEVFTIFGTKFVPSPVFTILFQSETLKVITISNRISVARNHFALCNNR